VDREEEWWGGEVTWNGRGAAGPGPRLVGL
jgi:hypothetical protein